MQSSSHTKHVPQSGSLKVSLVGSLLPSLAKVVSFFRTAKFFPYKPQNSVFPIFFLWAPRSQLKSLPVLKWIRTEGWRGRWWPWTRSWRRLSMKLHFRGRHWAQPSEGLYSITVIFSLCVQDLLLCSPSKILSLYPSSVVSDEYKNGVCICCLDLCALLLVLDIPPNLGPCRALEQIHFTWFLMKYLATGGTLLFWRGRTKWAPCQKERHGKEGSMTKIKWGAGEEGRGWREEMEAFKTRLYHPTVRSEGGSTPRHLWSTVVFGLPP